MENATTLSYREIRQVMKIDMKNAVVIQKALKANEKRIDRIRKPYVSRWQLEHDPYKYMEAHQQYEQAELQITRIHAENRALLPPGFKPWRMREMHIAYSIFRGRKLVEIEAKSNRPPYYQSVLEYLTKYIDTVTATKMLTDAGLEPPKPIEPKPQIANPAKTVIARIFDLVTLA